MKGIVSSLLDTRFTVLCSNSKNEKYSYLPLEEALGCNFVRFGNSYFIPAVSIDIDFKEIDIVGILEENNIPFPTMIVHTDRGYHLHWVLSNRINTKNEKQVELLYYVIKELQGIFGADIYATTKTSARVWRNPLKHKTDYYPRHYNLNDIVEINYTFEKVEKKVEYKKTGKYIDFLTINFSSVVEGHRHMALFDYGRAYAYTTGIINVFSELRNKNNQLISPLPIEEVKGISDSITKFMTIKYGKNAYISERQIKFNQKIASIQKDKKFNELASKILKLPFGFLLINKISSRKASVLFSVSKNTWLKHKNNLIFHIKNFFITFKKHKNTFLGIEKFLERTFKELLSSFYCIEEPNKLLSG